MTLAPDTIERKLGELARQYEFAVNVCGGLTEEVNRLNSEVEDRDILIADMRRQITELEGRQCQCVDANLPCLC